ncbi:glycosyltransferase [Microbacterium dauci]|uniref:Glycosyltransferase n=1 Tax=Microbacterium dauci TaxID=3048008 RepID=A0ABT6ZFG5_9MICO|nr:glycosyltransferase [Microbacterium sp. LX3-4]MDJ1114888.1 glycosyltransferase [Microbacterium sp. LX3-4]
MTRPVRVLSLYEGLFAGGARVLHTNVVTALHRGGTQEHRVLSIASQAAREGTVQRMEDDLRHRWLTDAGVAVWTLGRTAGSVPPAPEDFSDAELERAAELVADADVILTLKEQPLGLLLALERRGWLSDAAIAACLHRSDPTHSGPAMRWISELAASGRLTSTISCAHSTSDAYARFTGPATSRIVIPNGVDTRRFRPDGIDRARMREELGLGPGTPVVLFAARFDAMKDPELFLGSVAAHAARDGNAQYLLCGAGMTPENPALVEAMARAGVPAERMRLLGIRDDMPSVYRTADVVALTSAFGEASPLCLIEGAASGAIPVTTPVGDAARNIRGFGVVTPRDPAAIAAAWAKVISRRDVHRAAALAARPRLSDERMLHAYRFAIEGLAGVAEVAA